MFWRAQKSELVLTASNLQSVRDNHSSVGKTNLNVEQDNQAYKKVDQVQNERRSEDMAAIHMNKIISDTKNSLKEVLEQFNISLVALKNREEFDLKTAKKQSTRGED